MRINSLIVNNLSSFEGESSFDFSVNEESKNIILIGGKNGAGKSSLFLSMKLALYGPMAFKYQGINPVYINRIKELINHNAYIQSEVEAFTEIGIELFEDREYVSYRIKRTWKLIDKKLQENVDIYKGLKLLNEEEKISFNEYLNTVLPVNLFDLYFFDGEKIDEMFEGVKYNNFIKKSLLTLYSVDVFEVLRKYFDNYVVKTKGNEEIDEIQSRFSEIVKEIDQQESSIQYFLEEMDRLLKEIEESNVELLGIKEQFQKAGGLTSSEKESITRELFENEKIKNENNVKVKNFVEDLMPFIICGDYGRLIKSQLESEAELQRYNMLSEKFTSELTTGVLIDSISELGMKTDEIHNLDKLSSLVHMKVLNSLKPSNYEKINIIHDLSNDQRDRVVSTVNRIIDFEKKEVLSYIENKQTALAMTKELNSRLRNSLSETEVMKFMETINKLENDVVALNQEYENVELKCFEAKNKIESLEIEKHKTKELIRSKTQLNNVYELSEKLNEMMSVLVKEISRKKFNELEEAFLLIFKKIMRKDNIIDYIKINDDFSLNLYQEQIYKNDEIKQLINNLGFDKFLERIGEKGYCKLKKRYPGYKKNELKEAILYSDEGTSVQLYKKIGLSQLSKGEKQIFTLSLYWAMINIANHEIPFVIDTPYARIDTQHRDHITSEYFTTIGKQVVILSTDEEINQHYYDLMSDNIAHEYLLRNDNNDNKTIVEGGYFFRGEEHDI